MKPPEPTHIHDLVVPINVNAAGRDHEKEGGR